MYYCAMRVNHPFIAEPCPSKMDSEKFCDILRKVFNLTPGVRKRNVPYIIQDNATVHTSKKVCYSFQKKLISLDEGIYSGNWVDIYQSSTPKSGSKSGGTCLWTH